MSDYQPDWSKAPNWACFWARDKDGSCHWYSRRPRAEWDRFLNSGSCERDTNACPNWRETLHERPAAPDRNDWSGAPDWARARAWDAGGYEYWLDTEEPTQAPCGWVATRQCLEVYDYRWPTEGWKDSLLLRPIDKFNEIRKIREELSALTERLAELEEGA